MSGGVIRTTCPYCGVGCGCCVSTPDGTLSGDTDHPANAGRLCSKGAALADTLVTDGRLLYPQIGGRKPVARLDRSARPCCGALRKIIAATGRTRSRFTSPDSFSPRTITSPTS